MRSVLAAALFLAAATAALPVEPLPSPGKVRQAGFYCQNAGRYMQAGNVKKARELYEKAIGVVKFMPEAHIGLGMIAMTDGKFEDALARFELARDGYDALGELLFDMEMTRWRAAQEEIRTIREQINTMRADMMRGKGGGSNPLAEQRIRDWEGRIRNLEAIQIPERGSPQGPPGEVFFYIGNACFRLQRYDEARQAWETCAARSPKFPLVHNNLAILHWKAGRFDDARASIALAEQLGMAISPQFKADLEQAAQSQAQAPR